MTDQQRFDALSGHGGWVQTPHLDHLAAEGVDLQSHFSQAPVCVPSRSSLFSGRYPHSHRVLENDARLAPHEVHLFKALKQVDYHLSYCGKNHLLLEEEMEPNFDFYAPNGVLAAEHDAATRADYEACESAARSRLETIGSYASSTYHDFPDGVTSTGMIGQAAMDRVKAAPTDQPWCVVASFSDPHVPHLAPRRLAAQYDETTLPLPTWDPTSFDDKPRRLRVKREAQHADRATEAEQRHYLAVYGAMCTFVDEQIGRVLAELAAREDAANTMVVFVSDHGDFGWHHGLCKKDLVLYDDLLHVPGILHWPGHLPVRVVRETLTEHVDLMPTLLDLAGVEVPFGCQGQSLLPWLRGESDMHRTEVHAEVCYPWMHNPFSTATEFLAAREAALAAGEPLGRSAPFNVPGDYTKCLRTADWKYIWFGDGFEELYDLREDPEELRNLAGRVEHRSLRDAMRGRLFEWLARSADPRSPATERDQVKQFSRWQSPARS